MIATCFDEGRIASLRQRLQRAVSEMLAHARCKLSASRLSSAGERRPASQQRGVDVAVAGLLLREAGLEGQSDVGRRLERNAGAGAIAGVDAGVGRERCQRTADARPIVQRIEAGIDRDRQISRAFEVVAGQRALIGERAKIRHGARQPEAVETDAAALAADKRAGAKIVAPVAVAALVVEARKVAIGGGAAGIHPAAAEAK